MIKKILICSLFIIMGINYVDIKNNINNYSHINTKKKEIIEFKGNLKSEILTEKEEYLYGKLIISKISFNNNIYLYNNVNKGISIFSKSNNLIVLGAHSGSGNLAYFNELDKLNINDELQLNDDKYNIIDIYLIKKSNEINLSFKDNDKYLVLTTCSQKYDNMQLIIISKKINEF